MANLIEVTSVSKGINNSGEVVKSGNKKLLLNVSGILSVSTLATAVGPSASGITEIIYNYPVNNSSQQASIVVTEATSAILTAANAVPAT